MSDKNKMLREFRGGRIHTSICGWPIFTNTMIILAMTLISTKLLLLSQLLWPSTGGCLYRNILFIYYPGLALGSLQTDSLLASKRVFFGGCLGKWRVVEMETDRWAASSRKPHKQPTTAFVSTHQFSSPNLWNPGMSWLIHGHPPPPYFSFLWLSKYKWLF